MNKTRIAVLGTISNLHLQSNGYDLAELSRVVTEVEPDLLCVELERPEFEQHDLSLAPLEVRAALVPVAARSDTVIAPIGAGSNEELRAAGEGMASAFIQGLEWALERVQKGANGPRGVNSAFVSHTCGLICHLEEYVCGEQGRQAWEATNEKMLRNTLHVARSDPEAKILVAVQCRRKHWLEPRLRQVPELTLVNYWEL